TGEKISPENQSSQLARSDRGVFFSSASRAIFSLACNRLLARFSGSRFQASAQTTPCGKNNLPALIRFRIIPTIDSPWKGGYLNRVKGLRKTVKPALMERLALKGFRLTPQREHVYQVLLQERDHPTAEQVFMRAKKGLPDISMATVYNCLDFLVKCSLVKEVNLDRTAMRYCPNMHEHCHFHCDECGGVFDIDFCADD